VSPKEKPSKPLDIYARVSRVGGRDVEAEGGTAAEQVERCRSQLQASGLKAGKVFIDKDESGGKESRPGFDQALARVESDESGGIIVLKLSRFGRNRRVPLLIEQIEAWGGTLISVEEKLDTSTPMGKFAVDILAAVNTLYLEQVKDQWARTKSRVRAKGIHIGSPAAGYLQQADGTLAVDEAAAPVIRRAFELRANGASFAQVARLLSEQGVRTSKGRGTWSVPAARALIQNDSYLGDETHEEIVPRWLWKKAQPKSGVARVRGEGHVLGQGLCRCGTCGSGLVRSNTGGSRKKYVTLRCPKPKLECSAGASISYPLAEDWILSVAFSHLGPIIKDDGRGEAEIEAARARVEEAREALSEVEAILATAAPRDSKQWVELAEAEDALAALTVEPSGDDVLSRLLFPPGVRREFEKLPVQEQRRVLRQIVSKVVVLPGRAHVSERIEIQFTDGSWYGETTFPPSDPRAVRIPVPVVA